MKTEGIMCFIASLLLITTGLFLSFWSGYYYAVYHALKMGLSGLYGSCIIVAIGLFTMCLTLDAYWIGTKGHGRRHRSSDVVRDGEW